MATGSAAELEERGRSRHAEGDYQAALDSFEAAFAGYRDEGDLVAAARAARTVGWFRGWVFGEWAVAQGWSAQALALLERADDDRATGWVLYEGARRGSDLDTQRAAYLDAIAIARRHDDPDLECEATAALGLMLVFSGFVDEGMAYLDHALAAICGGAVRELPVVEGCLCGLLNACERTHDVDRAEQWLGAADDVIQRGNLLAVAGFCRAHYAGILMTAGRWAPAETELLRAMDLLDGHAALRESALCRLADLRVRQGRTEDAALLLQGLDHHEDATVPFARLHIAQDHPGLAIELLDRVLRPGDLPDYTEAPLRALAVDGLVSLGRLDEAGAHSDRLSALAAEQPTKAMKALAAAARAQICVATGRGDARACWHEAISLYGASRMPAEVTLARLELAKVIAADRPEVAMAEASAAFDVLDRLGAVRAADEAAALLRDLGAPARTGPKRNAGLTKREEEVLALVGHGLTNAEIGERLYISPKTVEHHVGRLLAKLGLRSRTEAAAYVTRSPRSGAR